MCVICVKVFGCVVVCVGGGCVYGSFVCVFVRACVRACVWLYLNMLLINNTNSI